MDWQVASDVGGTFTDIAHVDEHGVLHTAKVPSLPENYGEGVASGISTLAEFCNYKISELTEVMHGCTVATNAILEGKGARTALITTKGFKDVLELRRIRVPRLYEPLYVKPAPLCPRDLRFEVQERIGASGEIVQQISRADVEALAEQLKGQNIEAVAVCLLHSYINDTHERIVGDILRRALPDAFISLSVDVLPQIREYERTSTTVVNAYVGPVVKSYLDGLDRELAKKGSHAPVYVMQSSGGQLHSDAVKKLPAQIVECGPAAGVIAAQYIAQQLGEPNVITFDMGGTTAKASMIEKGRLTYSEDYEVGSSMSNSGTIAGGGGYSLRLPVINIAEVGAGGGSIVSIDKAGALKIGPESAGAHPGPACYGVQDAYATVTDANVLLGYLNPHHLAGGAVKIDRDLSYRCLTAKVMMGLGLTSVEETAYGIHMLANEKMVKAIKAVTTYRGRDPRDFAMIAFGGNGGIHGAGIARSLGVKRVIVPVCAGVFSAVGLTVAECKVTLASAYLVPLRAAQAGRVNELYAELHNKGAKLLGRPLRQTSCFMQLDLRAKGQAFEITVDLGQSSFSANCAPDIVDRFMQEYEVRYCHKPDASSEIEIVALRLTIADETYTPPPFLQMKLSDGQLLGKRQVYFGEGQAGEAPVVNRAYLRGKKLAGPMVIEEYEGTTVVPPGASVSLDEIGNIVIDLDGDQ
ncbi:hydantoinase/oxoprolinase family protein [Bordetella sp. BOR01]|uniref:hydantoinase/oxoprolinase family protein n=1 Tax=Bordetella sp. BOR01 TaxID=2854779 RepID=UPI001C489B39|nr:hydantoinase/oxoprolinase family protein [Bordetella sp. BOR01]MBV7483752.1 hydantoinase/oxoprolinase family protein [Bordetella sp. BOR01]